MSQPSEAHEPFPTLRIFADRLEPRGAYAVSQARYLQPDAGAVSRLEALLAARDAGVVAHFYMDPELQGVLAACRWPHIHVSDSLVMADRAVDMARAGARTIAVLGVDFMSENVRAMLDAAGFTDVPVYRVAADPIGCSLAEAADALAYGAYLQQAAATPRALHVVYINTSLLAKARAAAIVPTITCTSSNVVRTVLQAFAQVPQAHVFFGPDTYMGRNLRTLMQGAVELGDDACRALHPAHDAASVRSALQRFHHFEQGACVVHHLFGEAVVRRVREEHPDALYSAHLEVPGEMFALAAEAARSGRGVVGSTSNILDFVRAEVRRRAAAGERGVLEVVLGTEAGMITPIVREVQALLAESASGLAVDVIFPVAADAVAATDDAELGVVPGVLGGEGCSTAGGCATCPYMKMNTLAGLLHVLEHADDGTDLAAFHPRATREPVAGRSAAELGSEPILAMRAFGRGGTLPESLVTRIVAAS